MAKSTPVALNSAEPTMTFVAPSASTALRALRRADAAADTAGQLGGRCGATSDSLSPASLRRVEVDQLDLRLAAQALDPGVDVAGLDRQLLALHELHDPAALQVDGRNQHFSGNQSDRNARIARNLFKSLTACSE